MLFDKVSLEPVQGLKSRSIGTEVFQGVTLMPQDTRQYLFIISPNSPSSPMSIFPPTYPPGSVLPLGRLDVTWFSGPFREKGRLQTSTLNRRIPLSTKIPPPPKSTFEFDLVILEVEAERTVPLEEEFTMKLRLGVRSAFDEEPSKLSIAVQYLEPDESVSAHHPTAGPSSRPFSPLSATSSSRPSTPQQISNLAPSIDFPPQPYISRSSTTKSQGRVRHLGSSLLDLEPKPFRLVPEDLGTTYRDPEEDVPKRWETSYEFEWKFFGLQEGLAELGGLRVLLVEDGYVGREWTSLGDLWVQG